MIFKVNLENKLDTGRLIIIESKQLEKAAVDISPQRKPRRKQPGLISKIINKISGIHL